MKIPTMTHSRSPLLLCLILLFLCPAVQAHDTHPPDAPPLISVRGEARITAQPDQVTIVISVITQADTAAAAMDENTMKTGNIQMALKNIGLTDSEYQTGAFRIQPQWERNGGRQDRPGPPMIAGYQVSNSLKVTTNKIPLIGTIIEAGIRHGADSVNSILFELADPRNIRLQAIELATKNGRAEAETAAAAAGLHLGPVRTLTIDETRLFSEDPGGYRRGRLAAHEGATAQPPSITPGEISVTARVRIDFELSTLK
ncbi:SIMPL domain-containing protein [Thermodesulfobacteriota bacterium]